MSEEGQRLYTPIVLRTGFMHSYRRTIPLLLAVIILEALLWTLGGLWPRLDELALMRWGLIAILAVVVPIGTRTIRDVVSGFANMFDVFDELTEEKLKLYRSIKQTSPEKGMRPLFTDGDTYAAFQEKIRQVLFDKITDTVIIITILSITAFVVYITLVEKISLNAGVTNYPLVILEIFIDAYATLFIIAALSSTMMFGLGYFYTLNRLGRSKSDLSVWNYINYLRGDKEKSRTFMTYWQFDDITSIIGWHFSGITFRIVLLMAFGGLAQILYNVSMSTVVTWILASIPVALSMVILVLPLSSLLRVSYEIKINLLRLLEEEYDHLTLRFLSHLTELRDIQTKRPEEKGDVDLELRITSLRGIIEETRQQSIWPIKTPAVVRIIATSLMPLAIFFIQEFFKRFVLR